MKGTWLIEALGAASLAPISTATAVRARIPPKDVHVQHRPRYSNSIAATSHYVTLKRAPNPTPLASHPSRRHIAGRQDDPPPPGFPFNANLTNVHDIYYMTNITVGDVTLPVSIDTGSSDTWLIKSPFQCIDYTLRPTEESVCGFGEGFKGNLSEGLVTNEPFTRTYGDGTFVSGYFGFDDVTIGGVTVKHQQIAIVNNTYWYGDGKISGMLGLAYPLMTGLGSVVDAYDPIFTTMWKTGEILPLFTLALSRDDEGRNVTKEESSFLAFGGLPPVDYDDATWARAPIESMETVPSWGVKGNDARGLYIIQADAYVYGRENTSITDPESTEGMTFNTTQFPILVDSGSTLTILPTDLALEIFKSFRPPAQFLTNEGAWFAPCNAQMARFGVKIGTQQVYWMSPDDLLNKGGRDSQTGRLCRVGIMDSDTGPHILGVSWLANVVAVFDVGNDEMRFAKRLTY